MMFVVCCCYAFDMTQMAFYMLCQHKVFKYWGMNSMVAFLLMAFSGAFSWKKCILIQSFSLTHIYMGQVTELWLSCYLVLLSIDSKTR